MVLEWAGSRSPESTERGQPVSAALHSKRWLRGRMLLVFREAIIENFLFGDFHLSSTVQHFTEANWCTKRFWTEKSTWSTFQITPLKNTPSYHWPQFFFNTSIWFSIKFVRQLKVLKGKNYQKYFEQKWLGSHGQFVRGSNLLFCISFANQSENAVKRHKRTKNKAEGWPAVFHLGIEFTHPGVEKVLLCVKKIAELHWKQLCNIKRQVTLPVKSKVEPSPFSTFFHPWKK